MAKHPVWGQNSAISKSIVDLTDSSGGAASDTLAAIGGSYSQAELRNSIASLAAKIKELNDALDKYGITDSSGS